MRSEAPTCSTDADGGRGLAAEPGADGGRPAISDLVPDLAGLSVGGLDRGTPFTWTATDDTVAFLDACQYVAGGPCVTAVADGRPVGCWPAAADAWPLFSRACVAAGIGSVLSLPLHDDDDDRVVGSINLYATELLAFDGQHDELTTWSSQWGPATAVNDAGSTLSARWQRAAVPERHRDENAIDRAVAALAARLDTDVALAADLLRSAACRAGMGESAMAQSLDRFLGTP